MTGFRRAWRDKGYATIVQVARHLPSCVLQEDPALLTYYDNAARRIAGKRLCFARQAKNILVQVRLQAEPLGNEGIYQRAHDGKQAGPLGA